MYKQEKDRLLQTLRVAGNFELLGFLMEKKVRKSRSAIKSLLTHKQVKVNNKIIFLHNYQLVPGDVVTIHKTTKKQEYKQLRGLRIIYEDKALIVINKEAGLLTIATNKEKRETAYSIVSEYLKDSNPNNRVFILHRLDRETSGLMMFAKSEEVQEMMQKNWDESILTRSYVAVVEGTISPEEGSIISWLTEDKNYKMFSSFTDNGGQISFNVFLQDEDEESATIHFAVTDTGIGIDENHIKHLFDAFEQADNTIAARFGGTGLGLAISQNLIRLMGGEIMVDSVLGEGSTFSFTLQMIKAEMPDEKAAQVNTTMPDLKDKRIMLVEDIEVNRMILTQLLEDSHLKIDEAFDGAEAVKMFSESDDNYYDLIFMDIQMPNMNGYEATKAIRQLDRKDAKSIPILAMTANAYREDVENAFAAGMNGHLAKPIDISEVIIALNKWLIK